MRNGGGGGDRGPQRDKHLPPSTLNLPICKKSRHLGFGVLIDIWSMLTKVQELYSVEGIGESRADTTSQQDTVLVQGASCFILISLVCKVSFSLHHRVHTEWQWPVSDVQSIMMEKSALAGGWGVHPHPVSLYCIFHHVQSCSVYALAERANTLPVFHLYPMCTLWSIQLGTFIFVICPLLRSVSNPQSNELTGGPP
jgi:hypothetical protein